MHPYQQTKSSRSKFQNNHNLQSTRTYIFFEKGFHYYFNLFCSNKNQEALKLRRKDIIIQLKRNRSKFFKKHQQTIAANINNMSSSSPARIKFDKWRSVKEQNMRSLYSHRKSIAKQIMKDFRANFKFRSKEERSQTYHRFKSALLVGEKSARSKAKRMRKTKTYKRFYKMYNRTKRKRDRMRGRIQMIRNLSDNTAQYTRHAITIDEPFRKEWFTKDGYPLTSRDPLTGRFLNPWKSESTNGFKRIEEVWRWKKTRFVNNFLKASPIHDPDRALEENSQHCENLDIVGRKSREELLKQAKEPVVDKIKLTWIGHATTLVHISDKFTVLTDPIFSNKASPIQMFQESEFFGVPRWRPPSLSIDELGEIDVCAISHDHYDHLDLGSVEELHEKNKVKVWAVPLGLKVWLVDNIGIEQDRIVELEWWESAKFARNNVNNPDSSGSELFQIMKEGGMKKTAVDKGHEHEGVDNMFGNTQKYDNELVITCAPAQHWCSRTPFDRNTRLWCSWAFHSNMALMSNGAGTDKTGQHLEKADFKSTQLSFYFAGDTGYPKSFPLHQQIGDKLGPFDLSALPIGAYKPRFFMHDSHCDPSESLKIHQDIRSKLSVAVHWGTFPLANEPFEEPPSLLQKAIIEMKKEVEQGKKADLCDFVAIPHGESIQSCEQ